VIYLKLLPFLTYFNQNRQINNSRVLLEGSWFQKGKPSLGYKRGYSNVFEPKAKLPGDCTPNTEKILKEQLLTC